MISLRNFSKKDILMFGEGFLALLVIEKTPLIIHTTTTRCSFANGGFAILCINFNAELSFQMMGFTPA
jgi:hypothetical protein